MHLPVVLLSQKLIQLEHCKEAGYGSVFKSSDREDMPKLLHEGTLLAEGLR